MFLSKYGMDTRTRFSDLAIARQTTNYSLFFIIPVTAYFAYTFYQHLLSSTYMSFLDTFDFFVHELGHPVFALFWNQFIAILWGTLLQLLIPLVCMIWFWIQRDRFAVVFCYAWLGTNFFYISTYSSDAQKMALPLMWLWSGDPIHDWNFIFTKLWVLEYTDSIAFGFKVVAILFFIFYFIHIFFLIINKRNQPSSINQLFY